MSHVTKAPEPSHNSSLQQLASMLLVFALACGGSNGTANKDAGKPSGTSDAGTTQCAAPASAPSSAAGEDDAGSVASKATWTRVYDEVIVANTCDNAFCHADALAGGLNLSPDKAAAYTALVNQAPTGDPCKCETELRRVTPGKPSLSLMYNKLAKTPAVCGLNMPPAPYARATSAQIELVREWIAAGAKDD